MADTKIELHPESAGLVIVDMQVEGCERHGPGMKPVIGSIRRLLDRFRAVNGKIVHVQSEERKGVESLFTIPSGNLGRQIEK